MVKQVQNYKNIGMSFPILLENNPNDSSLGVGWYPIHDVDELIFNNVNAILVHEIGSRLNQEDFGTRLLSCIEEPNSQALSFLVNAFIKEAISKYEDRLIYKSSYVKRDGDILYILIEYTVRLTMLDNSVMISYDINQ